VPAPQRTARIEDEIWNPAQERAKAEGATLAALMRAAVRRYAGGHLTSSAEPASQAAAAIAITANGEPSPGVACAGPGCWQRNTSRFGLRRLPLCPACASALQGQVYKRQIPGSAAKLLRRGAA
jgi:hypothetical protein